MVSVGRDVALVGGLLSGRIGCVMAESPTIGNSMLGTSHLIYRRLNLCVSSAQLSLPRLFRRLRTYIYESVFISFLPSHPRNSRDLLRPTASVFPVSVTALLFRKTLSITLAMSVGIFDDGAGSICLYLIIHETSHSYLYLKHDARCHLSSHIASSLAFCFDQQLVEREPDAILPNSGH